MLPPLLNLVRSKARNTLLDYRTLPCELRTISLPRAKSTPKMNLPFYGFPGLETEVHNDVPLASRQSFWNFRLSTK